MSEQTTPNDTFDASVLEYASPFRIVSAEPLLNQWKKVSKYRVRLSAKNIPAEFYTIMSIRDYNVALFVQQYVSKTGYINATVDPFGRIVQFTPYVEKEEQKK